MRYVRNALVAIGANLPSGGMKPLEAVVRAIALLLEKGGADACASRLFGTPAFPPGSGPDFVNAAVQIPWDDTAEALLVWLNGIEARFGRTRTTRWEARIMDLDLIALGDTVLPDPETQASWAGLSPDRAAQDTPDRLILPHPRLAERSFVLVPLADIAPDWRHPVTGLSVADMHAALPPSEIAAARPVAPAQIPREPLPIDATDDM